MKYNHKKIEAKWQKNWANEMVFKAEDNSEKPKYFALVEFPYPSGDGLHVGHVRSHTALDVLTRKKRMQGFNVLYPMGWDAFGLPAENYAIKTGIHPTEVTRTNVKRFKKQIESFGTGFDWSREVNTTDPEYYRWTQWIFLKLLEKDLAYKKKMAINWCPSCKIGLANEEVIDGACERCHTPTERREIEQWMLKITAYADRLIEDLSTVDYLDKIKTSQINWIGRSLGAELSFAVENTDQKIKVFTTRPDTLFGATYLVLSPEHELVESIVTAEQKDSVHTYQKNARAKSEMERTELNKEKIGVFTGAYAINPVNNEKLPIWVADYVLSTYGTGAIMAVPAHDDRDFAFANKYELPIIQVVAPYFVEKTGKDAIKLEKETVRRRTAYVFLKHWNEDKYLCLNWEKFGWHSGIIGGLEGDEAYQTGAEREIREETGYTNFKLIKNIGGELHNHFYAAHKDQNRYAVGQVMLFQLENDEQGKINPEEVKNHEAVWIPAKEIETYINMPNFLYAWRILNNKESECYTADGVAINSGFLNGLETVEAVQRMNVWLEENNVGKATKNYHLRDWVFSRQHYWGEPIPVIHCESCGTVPVPENELPILLPKVEKYQPTETGESPLASIESWVNTTCPKCGGPGKRETDTMPNWAGSSWYFLRYCDPKNDKALASMENLKYWLPVDLYNGGMEHTTLHLLYSRFWNKFLYDIGVVPVSEPYQRRVSHGMILAPDGEKMSKSRGNVINPDDIIEEFGADVLRGYEMFLGPYDQAVSWDTNGIRGVRRLLDRCWGFEKFVEQEDKAVTSLLHKTIKQITENIDAMRFNTAMSALMIFSNLIEEKGCTKESFEKFLILLSTFMPHVAEELNEQKLNNKKMLALATWPSYDESLTKDDTVEIAVQVNGKLRATVNVSVDITEADLREIVINEEKVKVYLEGKEVKRFIYVNGKLVSLVV